MPDESGAFELQALAHERPARPRAPAGPARSRCAAATRHGSRIAASPPGSGTGSRCASRSKPAEVAAQQLAAPERPVGAVARAVEDERERRALLAVLGEARGGVGVVVLDADERDVLLERPLRREVLGVEVVGDDLRLDAEHRRGRARGRRGRRGRRARSRGRRGAAERNASRRACDAEGALQLRAGGDERRRRDRERQRRGRVAARAPDREGGADDRVLAAAVDRAVVREEGVRDPAEPRRAPRRRRRRSARRRRFPLVSTSGPPKSAAEQVVERRVGEHHPEPRRPRRDRLGDAARRRSAAASTIGRARRAQQLAARPPRPRRAPRARASSAANGFSSRCLRARSRATASSFAASQARW